jgi:gas vesicle protein
MRVEWRFLGGLAMGVGVGLILAPRSGSATRRAIREKGQEGVDQVASVTRKVGAQVKDAAARGKEQVAEALEAGKEAFRARTAGA